MMVVLAANEKFVVIFWVLSFGFTWRGIPAPKYKMHSFPSIVKILLFEFVRGKYSWCWFCRL